MKISSRSSMSPSPVLFYPSVHPPLPSLYDQSCLSVCLTPFLGRETLTRLRVLWKAPSWGLPAPHPRRVHHTASVSEAAVPSLPVPQSCSCVFTGRSWAITLPPKHLFTPLLLSICSPDSQSIHPYTTKINTRSDNPIHFSIPLFLRVHPSFTCSHPSAQVWRLWKH